MKRRSLLYQSLFVMAGVAGLGAKAQGSPINTQSTSFTVDIAVTTDTFETAGGAVLFTTSGVAYETPLSPDLVAGMTGGLEVSSPETLPSQVLSTLALIPEVSDYDFLTVVPTGISDYIVLNGVGPAFLGSTNNVLVGVADALVAAGGPGYSLTTPLADVPILTGPTDTYVVSASTPEPWVGDITIDVYDQNIVERAVATPEPKSLALLGAGMLLLIVCAWRKAAV
jgi:hypothetical protein